MATSGDFQLTIDTRDAAAALACASVVSAMLSVTFFCTIPRLYRRSGRRESGRRGGRGGGACSRPAPPAVGPALGLSPAAASVGGDQASAAPAIKTRFGTADRRNPVVRIRRLLTFSPP